MSRFQWLANVESGKLASFLLALTVSLPGDAVRGREAGLTSTPLNSVPLDPLTHRRYHSRAKKMSNVGGGLSAVRPVIHRRWGVYFPTLSSHSNNSYSSDRSAWRWRMWWGDSQRWRRRRRFSRWQCLPHAASNGYCRTADWCDEAAGRILYTRPIQLDGQMWSSYNLVKAL